MNRTPLPDPPIALKARLDQEEAKGIVQQLAPQFVPDGTPDLERIRRFTLGALKAWLHQGPPLASVSRVEEEPADCPELEGFRIG